MKYEWRKADKALYLPGAQPTVIDVPEYSYFVLSGRGNPNLQPFADAVGALYALSYTVKMLPKKGPAPDGYYEYTVFPLEGIWDLAEKKDGPLDKASLAYTIMIRQPDFVTDALALQAVGLAEKKIPCALRDAVHFARIAEGLCLQMLHVGGYDSEPETFAAMERFCMENGYVRTGRTHKEIYLSDPKKTPPDQLKTTLRFGIARK